MTASWPVVPGVPAAGHVTSHGGYWHPGNGATCPQCNPAPPTR